MYVYVCDGCLLYVSTFSILHYLCMCMCMCAYYYALTPFLFVQRDKLFPALGFGGKIGEQVRYLAIR